MIINLPQISDYDDSLLELRKELSSERSVTLVNSIIKTFNSFGIPDSDVLGDYLLWKRKFKKYVANLMAKRMRE